MTRTATAEWPEDLLGCPLRATYAVNVNPTFQRTSIQEAPPAFLNYKADEARGYTLSFLWTVAQLAVFQDWYENTINAGLRLFMMRQLTAGIMEPLMCQCASAYSLTPQQDHLGRVRVEFDVLAFWRIVAAPDWT